MQEILHQDFGHSALFLVDRDTGNIADKLDFFPEVDVRNRVFWCRSKVVRPFKQEFKRHASNQTEYFSGDNSIAQDRWALGLEAADIIEAQDFSYSFRFNCRSAIIFCLNRMGFEYVPAAGYEGKSGVSFDFSTFENMR